MFSDSISDAEFDAFGFGAGNSNKVDVDDTTLPPPAQSQSKHDIDKGQSQSQKSRKKKQNPLDQSFIASSVSSTAGDFAEDQEGYGASGTGKGQAGDYGYAYESPSEYDPEEMGMDGYNEDKVMQGL